MRTIKVGMINHNPTVGAFVSNVTRMIERARSLGSDCHVVVFPEGAVSGYPCEDMVLWPQFVETQWRHFKRLAVELKSISADTLYTFGGNVLVNGHVYNVIIAALNGELVGIVPKMYLADGSVFYDSRSLDRGLQAFRTEHHGVPFGDLLLQTPFGLVGLSTCEDIWGANTPIHRQAFAGAELIINQSASPFRSGIVNTRRELLATRSAESQATVVYVNQVGGNDSLNFDGGAYVFQNGRLLHSAPRWVEGVSSAIVDLDETRRCRLESTTWRHESLEVLGGNGQHHIITINGREPSNTLIPPTWESDLVFVPTSSESTNPRHEYFNDLLEGMIMGLGDYFAKSGHFAGFGISLSGGLDSVLCAYVTRQIAERRYGHLVEPERSEKIREMIWCISQPTRFNSATTKSIARDFAETIGATFVEESIEEAYECEVAATKRISGLDVLPGSTDQNIQARIRGTRMLNLSNARHLLFVQTGNMSETSVGYTTVGGDLLGAYGPIRNIPKTVIRELVRYLAERHDWPVLHELLAIPSSAELKVGQTDEADLMPYPVLDALFYHFAGRKVAAKDLPNILRAKWNDADFERMYPGYQPDMVATWTKRFLKLFYGSVFKWVLSPLGAHLGPFDLDRERAMQIPVIQSTEWLDLDWIY